MREKSGQLIPISALLLSSLAFYKSPLALAQSGDLIELPQPQLTGNISSSHRYRTAPSAGALYPLEVYVVVGRVDGLEAAVYRYDQRKHALQAVIKGDVRKKLSRAALDQDWVHGGAIALVFSAVYERTTSKYGNRGIRYVHIEAGHAMQNVYLQAEALGLGTVTIGAFSDNSVIELLHLDEQQQPLSIMPVGRPSR
jgi:SagB-type dehydrogenase family enzyme